MVDQQVEFPADFAEKFKELFPDHDSVDDVLQDQEIVYQLLKASVQNSRNSNDDHCDQEFRYSEEGQSSNAESADSQLALDEAIARSLMEEEFANVSISEPTGTAEGDTEVVGNAEVRSAETSVAAVNQDDINPDNMTYEDGSYLYWDRTHLDIHISTSIGEVKCVKIESNCPCVICCEQCKDKELLIALSCRHDYHKGCIAKWLNIRKTCPICQREVELPGF